MRALVCLVAVLAFAEASVDAVAKDVPEFLSQPITPSKREIYYEILDRKLLMTPADLGRMTSRPSFEGEFAVSIYPAAGRSPGSGFRVTLTEASKSIWSSLTPKQQGYIPAPDVKHNERDTSSQIPVKRIDVDIDRELALAIQRTWQAMLARNPVPDPNAERYISVDGYSAELSVRMPDGKTIIRETSNPHGQPARNFVQVGLLLADYCNAPVGDRPKRRKALLQELQHVFREAQKT